MRRRSIMAAVTAAVLAMSGLALAQDDEAAPPPLIFDDPPADPVAAPPIEEPPPAPGEVTPGADTATAPPVITAPVDTAENEKEDEEEEEEKAELVPIGPLEVQAPTGRRQRHGAAIIQALDKITAETIRFEVRVGRPVRYRGLIFTLRSCETSSDEEAIEDSFGYLQIRAEPKTVTEQQPSREVFRGWMFASSPGLNPLKHPVYDAWVIACKA